MNLDALQLPAAPKPLGRYVPAVRVGSLLFLSGMVPLEGDALAYRGTIGRDLSVEEGRQAVLLALKNALATAKQHLGSLSLIERVVQLRVTLTTTPEFEAHAHVADAASEFLSELFGERGHTRVVSGAMSAVKHTCAVLELVFEVRGAS